MAAASTAAAAAAAAAATELHRVAQTSTADSHLSVRLVTSIQEDDPSLRSFSARGRPLDTALNSAEYN